MFSMNRRNLLQSKCTNAIFIQNPPVVIANLSKFNQNMKRTTQGKASNNHLSALSSYDG